MQAHTLRDSQAQQNFHAIELPNIPLHLVSVYVACVCVYLVVRAYVCVCGCLLGLVGG